MEIVKTRYQAIYNALKQLDLSLKYLHDKRYQEVHDQMRNSTIKCLEFCIDTFWKFLQVYLTEILIIKLEKVTSRHIFHVCFQQKLISEEELAVLQDIVGDRNITSHTYNEDLAESISESASAYYQVMHSITERFSEILKQ